MGYAFISYSTQDGEKAAALRRLFQKHGVGIWMAPYDIPAGNKYAAVITAALKDCACIVLLLTEASQSSEWVDKEIERGINYRKTVIAVQLEDVILNDSFEFYLSNRQIIRTAVIDDSAPEIRSLLHSVIAYTGVTPPEEPEEPKAESAPAPAPEPTPEPEPAPELSFEPESASAPEPTPEPEPESEFAFILKSAPEPEPTPTPAWIAEGERNFLAGAKIEGHLLKRYKGDAERVAVTPEIYRLDNRAFSGQKSIRELYLPDSVTVIGEYAFNSCKKLETVRLPAGLRSLARDAFNTCKGLRSVYLPDGLEDVNSNTFIFCKNLAEVRLPAGLHRIGKSAFSWCKALADIVLPEGLVEIGKDAFNGTSLDEITIPGSVRVIEKGAFAYSNISYIVYGGTRAQWLEANNGNAWNGLPKACVIRCADGRF